MARTGRLTVLPSLVLLLALAPPALGGAGVQLDSPTTLALADVAWRGDGRVALAVGGAQGQGVVVKVEDGQATILHQGAQRYLAVAWHPEAPLALIAGDGALLLSDGERFRNLPLPAPLTAFHGRAIAWRPDGGEALIAGSALLRYWPANDTVGLVRMSDQEAFGAVAWRPQGDHALVEQARREDGKWSLGNLLTFDGSALRRVAMAGSGNALVTRIAWEPGGSYALLGAYDAGTRSGTLLRWDGAALHTVHTKASDRYTGIAFRGPAALLTGSTGQRLSETDGNRVTTLLDHGADLLAAAWQPGTGEALLAGAGGSLERWLPEGLPVARIRSPLAGLPVRGEVEVVVGAEPREGHPLSAVEMRVDGGPWQPMQAVGRSWVLPLDSRLLADGLHLLEARAVDAQGAGPPGLLEVRVANTHRTPVLSAPAMSAPLVHVAWTATGADTYELQAAARADFADARTVLRTGDPAADVHLAEPGLHYLRVRAVDAGEAGPWSQTASVLVNEPPANAPAPPASGGAQQHAGDRKAPGAGPALLALAAAAGAALARHARRR